jgi:hypothetical protein
LGPPNFDFRISNFALGFPIFPFPNFGLGFPIFYFRVSLFVFRFSIFAFSLARHSTLATAFFPART